ncbi:hypothetical protein MNBD_GAMMA22-951 [hydrothermal vent metagenome]|uniref:Tat (Twin-arginine translocation) pathway signal sequence domain protein n=1 Tax=hydrothermal vent metagenome TaxID=652676 RepID=A0A3B1B723_9ZZZZ
MVNILDEWDKELPRSILKNQIKLQDRRKFLLQLSGISIATTLLPSVSFSNTTTQLQQQPWLTFAAVQQHLFPATKDSPGASDINAALYLKNTLNSPDMEYEDKKFILNGVKWLNGMSNKLKRKDFILLNEQDREIVLRKIEQSNAGQNWLATILLYIFEALLTDPVYGGNPKGIGWIWLQHQPGFPLPTKTKKYYKL